MERKISSKPVDVSRLSPMMRQYWKVKEQYLEQLLFFRLGDFYELFFDDALIASRELELTLTGKECGLDERAPMCGIPYHSCENYIARLVKKGYKVAICEQMEDPATAKGLVKREIIRVITPGTVLESNMLDAGSNNYLCLIFRHPQQECFGVVFSDVSTGEVYALQVDSDWEKRGTSELGRFSPAEVLLNLPAGSCEPLQKFLSDRLQVTGEILDEEYFDWERCRKLSADQFGSEEIAQLENSGQQSVIFALGAMIHYLTQTQKHGLESLTHLEIYSDEQYMTLDLTARRNLELTRTLRDYGEEPYAWQIAGKIVTARQEKPILTTMQLADLVASAVPPAERRKAKNPARRTFQAIRIAVNSELDALNEGLDAIFNCLAPGGRLCVITFHSLEDRLVKNKFRRWAQRCTCPPEQPICTCGGVPKARLITRKPIEADAEELEVNRRSRSAKLRVLEKV